MVVNYKPGASGVVGMSDVLNGKPDGYKVSVVIAELVILPHLGLSKFTYADFQPVARLNADPSAITVRTEAPWNTIEEFLAAAKAKPGEMKWATPATARYGISPLPAWKTRLASSSTMCLTGAAPGFALLGRHIDAVTVSPGKWRRTCRAAS
jgi:tripartite-type tricarboxylate transporter receptor subunit TctC